MSSYVFLFKQNSSQARKYVTPVRWLQHSSLLLGERTMKNNIPGMPQESGYQAMRLATELFPATFAMIGAKNISPFWSVLFYFVLIMFGIGQQVSGNIYNICIKSTFFYKILIAIDCNLAQCCQWDYIFASIQTEEMEDNDYVFIVCYCLINRFIYGD